MGHNPFTDSPSTLPDLTDNREKWMETPSVWKENGIDILGVVYESLQKFHTNLRKKIKFNKWKPVKAYSSMPNIYVESWKFKQ